MADPLLPRPQSPMVDRAGQPTPEWYDFLSRQQEGSESLTVVEAQVAALQSAVAALEAAGVTQAEIVGLASVLATGSLADGQVFVQLQADEDNPAADAYYGTDSSGEKGWHALPTGAGLAGTATVTIPTAAFQHSETVAAVGVTPASVVLVGLSPAVDADDNDPELLDVVALWATPGTDQITFGLTFSTPAVGPVKLNWSAI